MTKTKKCGCQQGEICGKEVRQIARENARQTKLLAERAANELIDERCAAIAREVLRFDPRSVGPELRAVDPMLLQAALVVAYNAGRASTKRGAK